MTLDATYSSSLRSAPEDRPRKRSRSAVVFAGLALAAAGSLIVGSACVQAEAKFYIVQGTSIAMGGSCQASPVCDYQVGTAGVQGDQVGCYLVNSGLIPRGKNQTNHVETSRILLNEVDLEVFDPSGALVDSFSRSISGFVNPNLPEAATDALVTIPVLRTESVQKLPAGQQAVVGIVLKGRTTGGLDIKTPEYYAPIYLGNGACSKGQMGCCGLL